MSIRARLATITGNFSWALVAGKHFGYSFDTENPLTNLQCEYKFYYTIKGKKNCFHVLVYNKLGVYEPAMGGLMKQLKSFSVGSGFIKSVFFCLAILLFLWVSKTCRNYDTNSESVISSICEHKSTIFFSMALGVIVVMTMGGVVNKIGALKKRSNKKQN